MAAFGTQTAAVCAQGLETPDGPGAATNTSFEFNGSSWTAGNAASNSTGFIRGFGTLTAGATCGGYPNSTNTEEYDGTNFSTGGAMNAGRGQHAAGGTQTAGIAFAGSNPPPATNLTETYDGNSWTVAPTMNQGFFSGGGCGATNSAAIGMGGYTSPGAPNQTTGTELYNGTAWVTQPNMSVARGYNSVSFGISTSAVTVGDFPAANSAEIFTGETETPNVTDFSTE
jgi:hypothetical protein